MNEHFQHIIHTISKGDTTMVERFFRQPGGRKYLENITLILIGALPYHYSEKEELFLGFVEVLDNMEGRIQRQKQGEEMFHNVFGHT